MPTTYPIHPGDRLQRRIVSILTDDILSIEAFEGFTIANERSGDEMTLPFISVQAPESQNIPPASHVWHVNVTVVMVEDRQEANTTLGADSRPRHELRTENLSARLMGKWNTETLADSINAISNGQGVYVLKIYDQNFNNASNTEDVVGVEWSFTAICVSTQQ